jgi:nitrate reductase beta subunit
VAAAARPDAELVEAQRDLLLDPSDPAVAARAHEDGVPDQMIESARRSPVWRFVKEWGIALPLHAEYRTVPMLFYVPPLLPVVSAAAEAGPLELAGALDRARLPLRYLASLFSAGNEEVLGAAYRRLAAVRLHRRALQVGDVSAADAAAALAAAGLSPAAADEIHRMTALASMEERIVVPGFARETQTDPVVEPQAQFGAGFGILRSIGRAG